MRRLVHFFVCALIVILAGCGGASGEAAKTGDTPENGDAAKATLSGKVTLSGSSTVAPIVSEMGKKFEKLHPNVRVDVQTGGSSRGIADARSGVVDIGLVSRALKADETDLKAFTVAMDGVCVILHKDNPVKELTDAQVVSIYTGEVKNWKDVGGNDAQIVVVNKAEGRSTLELFAHYYKIKNSDIKAHVVIGDNEQAVKTVVGNVNGIGYVSIGTAEYNAMSGTAIKLLAVGGVEPTMEKVKEGKFPLSRPLNLVTKGEPKPLVKAFIDFVCSEKANETIKEQFFVPIK